MEEAGDFAQNFSLLPSHTANRLSEGLERGCLSTLARVNPLNIPFKARQLLCTSAVAE